MSAEEILLDSEGQMEKALDAFHKELASIRTGRAHPSLLDHIKVDVYGQMMNLNGVASVVASDARMLTVTVWDVNNIKAVDNAIRISDLGLNPSIDGNKLFINLPDLTADRRQEMIKLVKKKAEDIKIGIRNCRRDANDALKKLEKDKVLSEDELKDQLDEVQKLTDKYIALTDESTAKKEKELQTI